MFRWASLAVGISFLFQSCQSGSGSSWIVLAERSGYLLRFRLIQIVGDVVIGKIFHDHWDNSDKLFVAEPFPLGLKRERLFSNNKVYQSG